MTHRIATFLSVAAVLGASSILLADKPAKPRVEDRAKKLVEAVPETLVLKAALAKKAKPKVDITKEKIEAAPKEILERLKGVDITKARVEALPKALVEKSKPVVPKIPLDVSKGRVEARPKALIAELGRAVDKPARPEPKRDFGKYVVEAKPRLWVAGAAPKPATDESKRDVEVLPETIVNKAADKAAKPKKQLSPPSARGERAKAVAAMKKVSPGKVRWHADFKTAKAKSAKSKRPVLLFQLLGQMDEEFT